MRVYVNVAALARITDGAFRRDVTFVPLPEPASAVLEEAWRRGIVLARERRDGDLTSRS